MVVAVLMGLGLGACQADDGGDDDGGDSGSASDATASGGSASGGSASGGSASGGSASGGSASGGSASGGSASGGSADGSTSGDPTGDACEAGWSLGKTPYVGDTILDACDANPPQNCVDGYYIVFDDTGECICLPSCSSFVDVGLGDPCNQDGSVVCTAIENGSGTSSGNFCVPTQWGLCGP